jgi:exodeoxyribonuclease V alpha subunit
MCSRISSFIGRDPVVELKDIFRQAAESRITVNAHRINAGLLPEWRAERGPLEDFYFIEQDDPEQALRIILELVCERIPRRFDSIRVEDIQVLSPMHKGKGGDGEPQCETPSKP